MKVRSWLFMLTLVGECCRRAGAAFGLNGIRRKSRDQAFPFPYGKPRRRSTGLYISGLILQSGYLALEQWPLLRS